MINDVVCHRRKINWESTFVQAPWEVEFDSLGACVVKINHKQD